MRQMAIQLVLVKSLLVSLLLQIALWLLQSTRFLWIWTTKQAILMSVATRKNMIRSLEGSLKRLNTDYVDLFWLHAWDYLTPVEEVMRAFDGLVRQVEYSLVQRTPEWDLLPMAEAFDLAVMPRSPFWWHI